MSARVPAIPAWLAHRPTVGGLVVPWITPHTPDGRWLFGVLNVPQQERALLQRRCQVCGRPLEDRCVLFVRQSDKDRQRTAEPAVDPVCAAYSADAGACPMLAGQMRHYRSTPHRLGQSAISADPNAARLGAPAEPWWAVWLPRYDVVTDPDTGLLNASYAAIEPRRVRPVTPWLRLLLG